jgi:hypothetical protein
MRSLYGRVVIPWVAVVMAAGGVTARGVWGHTQEASSLPVVARTLAEQGKARDLPANLKGRIKDSIKEGAAAYSLPAGSSPALLFKLPGYSAPYTLTVTSLPRGFGTWQLFVPAIVLLDSDFQPTREVPEADFVFKKQTFSKSQRLEVEIAVDESSRGARYLFMYTNGALIGEMYGVFENKAYGTLAGPVVDVKLMRSLHGSVEIEAQPAK